jgi:hypothetical protein
LATVASSAARTPILDRLEPLPPPVPQMSSSRRFFVGAAIGGAVAALFLMTSLARSPAVRWIGDAFRNVSPADVALAGVTSILVVIAMHECGHALAGWLAGFRIHSIRVNRFEIHWPFRVALYRGSQSGAGGWVVCTPGMGDHLAVRSAIMVAGGPLTNLLSAVIVFALPYPKGPWSMMFVFVSLVIGGANLFPFRARGVVSDGYRLLMLVRDRARAERWLASLKLVNDMVNGVPAEKLAPEFITMATAVKDDSVDTVSAHAIAYAAAFHRRDIAEAARLLEVCLQYSCFAPPLLREALMTDAVIFHARRRHDAERAAAWLAGMPEKTQLPWLRHLAEAAILEAHRDLDGARAKLDAAEVVVRARGNPAQQSISLRSIARWQDDLARSGSR